MCLVSLPNLVATAILALGLITSAQAANLHGGKRVKQARFAKSSRARLRKADIPGSLTLWGTTGGFYFYQAPQSDGQMCYFVGPAADSVAVSLCPTTGDGPLLSATHPVLETPFFVSPTGHPEQGKLVKLFGFATDHVARIVIVARDGSRQDVPVIGGMFATTSPISDAVAVEAESSDGTVVYRHSYRV